LNLQYWTVDMISGWSAWK